MLLDVVSTRRLLGPSYRIFAGLRLSCPSGAQHETSSGPTRVPNVGVSLSAVEYTSAVHARQCALKICELCSVKT